jgi:hypothetical protein
MAAYRIRYEGRWADIDADSPRDAVARVKDSEHLHATGSERPFQIFEILRFEKKRSAKKTTVQEAKLKYLETIVIRS